MACLNFEYHFWSGYYYTLCLISYVLLLLIITMVRVDPIYFILAGLDDTTAAGLNGFALLQNFASGFDLSLHLDVFFYKSKNKDIVKFTYFTGIERCDQGLVDVLSISDVVLEEFKQDLPSVNMLFCKSDNANCYHSNFAAEGFYHLCKQHGIQLLRYDYNEPSKGKDQCDRESATAKALLRKYVDAGNDLANANDIYSGLHYASGVANAKVAVIDIDKKVGKVVAQEIPFITQYRSFKFQEDTIKVWRCFYKELKCHILIPLKLYLEQ